jgi:hypothetical protein
MLTQLNEGAKNHEVCKFSMFRVVPRKREGKADSANAWHALRSIILVLAAYTASQHAAGVEQFLPSTYLYSVHCRTNSQFSDLVTFILFFFSISLRSTWKCSAEHLVLRGAQFGNVWLTWWFCLSFCLKYYKNSFRELTLAIWATTDSPNFRRPVGLVANPYVTVSLIGARVKKKDWQIFGAVVQMWAEGEWGKDSGCCCVLQLNGTEARQH